MSLFGKDIESNICTLITFADGAVPTVLASLKNSNIPFGETFTFNNSALFAENQKGTGNPLSLMFWKMECSSFEIFFASIWKMETKSLLLTKNVLVERNRLKTKISNVFPLVFEGLQNVAEIKKEQEVIKKYRNEIEDNKHFYYTVEEMKQQIVDLEPGVFVTNCLICNITCHHPCDIPNDSQKRECTAINRNTGKCEVCPRKCDWTYHKSSNYYLLIKTVKVKKTYDVMKKRYDEATEKISSVKQRTQIMKNALNAKLNMIKNMMDSVNKCRTRLQEIALAEDPLTSEEYIDLMIESEKREHKAGYADRIKTLEELKKMSRIDKEYAKFNEASNEVLKSPG